MIKHIIVIALAAGLGIDALAERELYVSPRGNDRNPGTREKPLQSLEGARRAVRRVNRRMDDDIVVRFAGGTYAFDDTVAFTAADSGMNGHRVIYQAYEDQEPVFSGATKVAGWKPFKDGIYQAKLARSSKLRSLIVNGERAYMASKTVSPKGTWGEYKIKKGREDWAWIGGSKPDGIKYSKDEVPSLANPEDVEIWRNTKWNTHIVCARDMTSDGGLQVLKMQQPSGAVAFNQKWGGFAASGRHTLYNAFEFLDEPGEFYFDRKKKTIYYMPRDGEDMSTAEVFAPRVGELISIQGESTTARVENLSFVGLTFAFTEGALPMIGNSAGKTTVQAATWCVAFDENNWHETAYRAYDTMPNAVSVSGATSIQFRDNVFKHLGNEGIGFINDVSDAEFVGNLVRDIGGGAIQVGHPQHVYIGDEHDYAKYSPGVEGVCRNILVENNVMYDMTTLFYGHAPITAYFADGLKIVKNHIQKCNYSAVSLGWGWNNFDEGYFPDNPTTVCRNNKFDNNRVYDCMRMLHDGGAFYTLGSQPNSTASGNYVKADSTHFQGVYHPDEGTAWYTGKDLVFEIMPDQDNFELNKWRRKHDNHYSNIYSTSENQQEGAPNCTITDLRVIEDANWPEPALAIIRDAGVEESYHHLLSVIPDMIFEPGKRYDTKTPILTPEILERINQPQESTEGRYEAERAKLSGGAKVKKNHPGYSGDGFVEGYYKSNTAKVTFKVSAAEMGTHNVILRYAAGHGDSKNTAIYVNGEKGEMLALKSTGDWDTWSSQAISVFLNAGMNTISFKAESQSEDSINIDYIQVSD